MKIGLLKLAVELHKNKTFKNVKSIMDMGNKSIRCNYENILYLFDQAGIEVDKRKFNFLKKFPKGDRKSISIFWKQLGIKNYNCIDIHGKDNSINFDLNYPFNKKEHFSKYDLVTDIGNNEHIFNVGEAYKTMYKLCKKNGFLWIFQAVYKGNGFFNYDISFFEGVAAANKLGTVYSAYVVNTSDYDQFLIPADKDLFNVIDLNKVNSIDITYIFKKITNDEFNYYNQYQYKKKINYSISFLNKKFPPERYYIPTTSINNSKKNVQNKFYKELLRRHGKNK